MLVIIVGPVGGVGTGSGASAHSAVHSPTIVKATVLLMLMLKLASPQMELQPLTVGPEVG